MSHFGLRLSKSQAPDKSPYTIYYPHTLPATARTPRSEYTQWTAIDPGRKNLGLRIERRYPSGAHRTIVMESRLVETVIQDQNLTIQRTYDTITTLLDLYLLQLLDSDYLLIERQLPQNYKSTRVAQHILSYFLLRLANSPRLPAILEIDPKLKTKSLNAPKGMTERELKKWTPIRAEELLTARGDEDGLHLLRTAKKKDEFGDTICMIEAMNVLWQLN